MNTTLRKMVQLYLEGKTDNEIREYLSNLEICEFDKVYKYYCSFIPKLHLFAKEYNEISILDTKFISKEEYFSLVEMEKYEVVFESGDISKVEYLKNLHGEIVLYFYDREHELYYKRQFFQLNENEKFQMAFEDLTEKNIRFLGTYML